MQPTSHTNNICYRNIGFLPNIPRYLINSWGCVFIPFNYNSDQNLSAPFTEIARADTNDGQVPRLGINEGQVTSLDINEGQVPVTRLDINEGQVTSLDINEGQVPVPRHDINEGQVTRFGINEGQVPVTRLEINEGQVTRLDINEGQVQVATIIEQKYKLQKNVQSAKKNSEHNIIYQLFSWFIYSDKSEKIVESVMAKLKMLHGKEKIKLDFYNIMRQIQIILHPQKRRYVNTNSLIKFLTPNSLRLEIRSALDKLKETITITPDEFCSIFRSCSLLFLRGLSVPTVLTNKRFSIISKKIHLKKIREIMQVLHQALKHQSQNLLMRQPIKYRLRSASKSI